MQTSLLIVAVVASFAHAADPVQVGGVCGGGTADAPVCDPMLDCVLQSNAPGSTGICAVKVSEAGGPCQQNHFNSAVCKSGLICVKQTQPADGIPRPGGSGMCQFTPDSYVPVGAFVAAVLQLHQSVNLDWCVLCKIHRILKHKEFVRVEWLMLGNRVSRLFKTVLLAKLGCCTTTAATVITSAVATKSVVTTAPAAPTSIKSAALVVEGISATVLSVVISLFL
ncbi:hypothetical protein BCR33DRAFT_733294 [Rhizoclosmatium globosum]|uniref:IGFBP N-terminal domain-containing protein n=1 Tax=Rhizoclosmatium globosum TaxID=329046 RepID=A0A1Y2D026_9FUNG|nr:hypothetical protein BCR33DRAFT_733294 [Rhizoclosmatium globosum]|eukprot:ORY52633.1 hypothetical protein BCR33DRAFT_733294 [Rhizoclosmatium globosum]